MATYATKQNMIDQFGQDILVELTDREDPATGEIVDSVLNAALEDAAVKVNSYVSKRYTAPLLPSAAAALRRVEMSIAFYYLHRSNYPDTVRKEFEDALDYLLRLSRGDVVLDVAGEEPESAPAQVRITTSDRTFNRETLKGF